MAGNLLSRRKEKTKIGGFGFRWGRGGGRGLLRQLCRPLSPGGGGRAALGVVSPFPGQPAFPTRLPTSTQAELGAPGPGLVWPCPRKVDLERTWGCLLWHRQRWVLRPPLWGRMDEFGGCSRVRKSCCRTKARLSDPPVGAWPALPRACRHLLGGICCGTPGGDGTRAVRLGCHPPIGEV